MTITELAAALTTLDPDVQEYEVWVDCDPSMPLLWPPWIDHDGKRVIL